MAKYRIQTDTYDGLEVVIWRWWWPFWTQFPHTNTHSSYASAEAYLKKYVRKKRRIVKEFNEHSFCEDQNG